MQRKQEGEPSRRFVNQQKESSSLRGVVPTQAREASRVFFTVPIKEGAKSESTTIWGLLCEVADGLQREVQQEPGATFALSRQERSETLYPTIRSLSQASSDIKDFKRLIELYGQISGHIPLPKQTPSLHSIYETLHYGRNGINTLVKTLSIARIYYQRHKATALLQPAQGAQDAIAFLFGYFQPNNLLFSEISYAGQPTWRLSYV